MTGMIHIDPSTLEQMCNRIDAWAESLKTEVSTRATQEVAQVQGLPNFQGHAADAYRAKFEEITTQIRQSIEQISDQQLGSMRERLRGLGRSFQDLDQQVASGMG
jgi:uncharacterized protein YukE